MSKALERVPAVDFDALWNRGEPDLELSDDRQIRPVRSESTRLPRNVVLSALGIAAPAAVGSIAGIALGEVARWD